jgi:plastocyanin
MATRNVLPSFVAAAALLVTLVDTLRARTVVPTTVDAEQTRRSGTIHGRVRLARTPITPVRRPSAAAIDPDSEPERMERPISVVYLDPAPQGAFDRPPPKRVSVDQRNETFDPHVVAVPVGSTVDFPNSDRIYHNVFSLSKAGRFDLGRYGAGRSKSVTFSRPGVVRVFCDIHSHMSAFVLVFSHAFFTLTDVEGRYRMDNVPPGSHRAVAWNEGTRSEASVTVPDGGATELDFALR